MRDLTLKESISATLAGICALLFVIAMAIYLIPVMVLVVIAAKGEKYVRMKVVERDRSLL